MEKEPKHISGVFMRIKTKGHKPDTRDSKTRIFVMDIPSGELYDGLLATDVVRSLKLRDYISVDLEDYHRATPEEVFNPKNFGLQPKDCFSEGLDSSMF